MKGLVGSRGKIALPSLEEVVSLDEDSTEREKPPGRTAKDKGRQS